MDQSSSKRFFKVTNFAAGGTQPLLYDLTNATITKSTDAIGAASLKFVLPPSGVDRELFLRADLASTVTNIAQMDTITFQNYTSLPYQGDYLIITNKKLLRDSLGHNPVQDYANYRDKVASPFTGKYNVRIFDIDQLYDQFGYGVRKSALAIRNFVEYAYDKWTKKPKYLFLIGKGRDYKEIREQGAAIGYDMCLIPTFGRPASDNLLVCRRGSNRPLVAVGRLAARTPYDVQNYLDKVTLYEQVQGNTSQTKQDKLWMKQIMHLAGGTTGSEQAIFAAYLQDYERVARDTSWGANVFNVAKTTSAPIDVTQSQMIRERIDSGISLMTFFGHAAGTAFDISVDNPEDWQNYDKYPIIYSNGCLSGGIHDNNTGGINGTYSERFVLTPGKGAIAFTATTGLSVSSGLYGFGMGAYGGTTQNHYNGTWGEAVKFAQIAQDSLYSTDDLAMMVSYDMTLHGDPAIRPNQYNKPDYMIDQSSVFFTPQTVNAGVDTFKVNVIITNLGKAIKDSMMVTVCRSFPDPSNPGVDSVLTYKFKVKATYYIDTVSIKLPTFPSLDKGFGLNRFYVYVESEQRIDELSETNNGGPCGSGVEADLQIESDDVIPIYPYEFAIVPKQNPVLKASTVNPFAPIKKYKVEIDTSELFVRPLATTVITQPGGVVHWAVPITMIDSTVYYWRISRDSISDTLGYKWHYSSFIYLKNEYPGWNQSHYFQYKKDRYSERIFLDNDRTFKYKPTQNDIHVSTGWTNAVGGIFPSANIEWDLNSTQSPPYTYKMGNCGSGVGYANPQPAAGGQSGGFTFAVIDTVMNSVWQSHNQGNNFGQYGNIHCNGTNSIDWPAFDFNIIGNHPLTQYGTWSSTIMKFLDSIPDGKIVLMYSVNRPDWTNIDSNLINKLVAMGATSLPLLKSGAKRGSYAFFAMKGRPSVHGDALGRDSNYTALLDVHFTYTTLSRDGNYQSPLIGPAADWGSFHWRWHSREHPSSDVQSADIYGIMQNGTEVRLLNTQTLDTSLNFVNAAIYPYIKLVMNTLDDTTHTPSQLDYWRVLYKKVPEAAINPYAHFKIERDTVGLGDSLNIEIALENVTELPMDSMRSLYTLKSLSNGFQQNIIIKQDSLRAFDTLILKFKQPITNTAYSGRNRMVLEANPLDSKHQREEYHFNNYATIDFSAKGDKINPLLDVTFDGRRIMNGDIISPKPDILITMKDENKFLALNDTSLAQVYIRYPGQSTPTLINYDNNILTFYPATGDISKRNQARIEFKPTFTVDGTYELLVFDKDRSGNTSSPTANKYAGNYYYNYKISFDIITKSMITNVLNYPNPFTTRTQFVFTLTGTEVPDYMKIQIMTITGKVVKEITKAELGDIHIGLNRTSYYWDGRDEYGDKLANGVYFYRVITNMNNKQLDNMSSTEYGKYFNNTNIDKYFKNGFGKMVIMR
jgi:hypothetical protein